MPTATTPPRCPHRLAPQKRFCYSLLIAAVLWPFANESTKAQDNDLRFVHPTSHMQPWHDGEPESTLLLLPNEAPRGAAKWRINLMPPAKEATDRSSVKQAAPKTLRSEPGPDPTQAEPTAQRPINMSQLPSPVVAEDAEPSDHAEVLTRPQRSLPNSTTPPVPVSTPDGCYQSTPLAEMSFSVALPRGAMPDDMAKKCAAQIPPTDDRRSAGGWAMTEHQWAATCLCHRPLYFEEINAERYGYTVSYAFQPVISAARFFATIPALPYKMVVERPRDCIYTLGHYRPGSCAPRRWNRLPWKLTASVVETGFIAGMILLIP